MFDKRFRLRSSGSTGTVSPRAERAIWLLAALSAAMGPLYAQDPQTIRVSVSSKGDEANGYSNRIDLSADGRVVAFRSLGSNLVAGDSNEASDVFVRDLAAGVTTRVSVASDGTEGDLGSESPSISRDGRFVAYVSEATNLVPNDSNGLPDVFVHDRLARETRRVNVSTSGEEASAVSWLPILSADGRLVLFLSDADNLDDDPNGHITDLFVHNRQTGETSRVRLGPEGVGPNGLIRSGSMSDDGRWVAFHTDASNLVPGDNNGLADCFVHDRLSGETRRVSVDSAGGEAEGTSLRARISGDGRLVAFDSSAPDLVSGDTNDLVDVFVHDLRTSRTERISTGLEGQEANGTSQSAILSRDGRFVAYFSAADNLVTGDSNANNDVFRYDRWSGETIRMSRNSLGEEGNGSSSYPHISDSGEKVIFQSGCTNLVPEDNNQVTDVFLRSVPLNELYFAQFGDGNGLLFSQLLLFNLGTSTTNLRIGLRDNDGLPLDVDLNGEPVSGSLETTLGAGGVLSLKSDGQGDLAVGSVSVDSSMPISGHILFGGAVGLAGVSHSAAASTPCLAPVENKASGSIRTGIAVMNLEVSVTTVTLRLRDAQGLEIDSTAVEIPERGHLSLYLDELDWPTDVSFGDFLGSVLVVPAGRIAATVIQTRPGQLASLPVVPLGAVVD